MILLIDNYDSFVYNLARYVGELGYSRLVKRNDAITLAEITALNPSHIIISPGPCSPTEAGISIDLIRHFTHIPILGVCLGHQAISQAYGGAIIRAKRPMHGKASPISHNQRGLFANIQDPVRVARYHSLIVDEATLSTDLEITARCDAGEIMGIQHKTYPTFGVQFHPESVLTEQGYTIMKNFLRQSRS